MMEVPPPDNFLDMGKEEGRWKTRQAEPGGVEEWGGIGIFSSKMPGSEGGGRLHFTNNLEPWIGGHSPRALSMYQFLAEWRVKVKEGEPGWREDITFTFVSNVVSILFLFFSAWQGVDRLESARKCKINCSDFKTSLWQQLRHKVQSRWFVYFRLPLQSALFSFSLSPLRHRHNVTIVTLSVNYKTHANPKTYQTKPCIHIHT